MDYSRRAAAAGLKPEVFGQFAGAATGGKHGLVRRERTGLYVEHGEGRTPSPTLPSHPESFPVNALVPIKGTPLGDREPVKFHRRAEDHLYRPHPHARYHHSHRGRRTMSEEQQAMCFMAGAKAVFNHGISTVTSRVMSRIFLFGPMFALEVACIVIQIRTGEATLWASVCLFQRCAYCYCFFFGTPLRTKSIRSIGKAAWAAADAAACGLRIRPLPLRRPVSYAPVYLLVHQAPAPAG
ncbi:hypothetical protein VDGD_01937 [Verticillium dahliae]|nr:hypothetical protein VDGD_01937 [Verticillium dahliae]